MNNMFNKILKFLLNFGGKRMKTHFKKFVGISMATVMSVSLLSTTALAETPATEPAPLANDNLLRLWYDEPADQNNMYSWQTEALAIGNGYMGGLLYGGVKKDKIHINEKTVWNGGPSDYGEYKYGNTNPTETEEDLAKIKADLKAIREKLDDKSEYVFGFSEDDYESSGTATYGEPMNWLNKLMGDLTGYAAPQDFANLYISNDTIDESKIENYVRDLDMRTALSTVNYDYEGVHYTKEYFNSHPDNVLVVRLTADKSGKITFTTNLADCTGTGSISASDDTITMTSTLWSNKLKTEAQLKVIPEGGELTSNGTSVTVTGADSAILVLACGTDYKMELPSFRGEDPHEAITSRIASAADIISNKGYDALKKRHVDDHSALFSRMELGFNEEIPQIPTDELIKKYRNMIDKNGGEIPTEAEQRALEIMCYQFGRYLTIAGSREGSLPTNLQGVWGERNFAWGGDYHFNINVQMNYWPTMASNLGECHIPYNDYLAVLREAGRGAAAAAFGIKSNEGEENGWLVGCFSTPYMFATMGQKNNAAGWNPIGSAWALLNCYEYYLYTGDQDYLRNELYPSMKEVANFWNEALYWSEYQQRYVSSPSYSPENGPIVSGASYDQQFIWQHFENTIQAAKILGEDDDLIAVWEEKQSKLDPVLVSEEGGQVKEWFEETSIGKAQAGDLPEIDIPQWRESLGAQTGGQQPPHRHLSHLMALYPGNLINKDNAKYMDAAIVSLNERGLDATGWSKAHKLNLWARTGHSEEAFQIVQSAVGGGNSGFLTNMFSSHGGGANYKQTPIFQIDGNFGYTAGVNEMLLQSQLGYVQFLPTLPEQWNTGYVNGIVARGNFVVDMKWTDGVAESFKITSRNGGEFTGEYPNLSEYVVKDSAGNLVATTVPADDVNKLSFATTAGESYTISKAETYNITVAETQNGTVSAPTTANEGSTVAFTVTPSDNYVVDSVTVTDASESTIETTKQEDGSYTFMMPSGDVTITANFKEDTPIEVTYKINVPAPKNGTVEIAKEAVANNLVKLTVKPDKGYAVANVVINTTNGQAVAVTDEGNGIYSFTMPASDINVNVTFRPEGGTEKTYQVNITDSKNGKVTAPQTSYVAGSKVVLTVTPDKGYKLDKIIAATKENKNVKLQKQKDGTYTFEMPANDVTVKASFKTTGKPVAPDSKPNKPGTPPKTGDNTHFVLWGSLIVLSLGAVTTLAFSRKKKRR